MSVTTEAKTRPATKRANKTAQVATSAVEAGLRRRRSCGVGHCWWWHRLRRCASAGCSRVGLHLGNHRSGGGGGAHHHPAGALISRDDLVTVRIGVDPAPIPAAQLDGVVGQRAAMDLPAGGLVTQDSITAMLFRLRTCRLWVSRCRRRCCRVSLSGAGDQVRVVATPGQQGEVTDGEQRSITATVVGVYPDADSGQTVVSVQVPYDQAAGCRAVPAGKVAVVLDSRER